MYSASVFGIESLETYEEKMVGARGFEPPTPCSRILWGDVKLARYQ